MFARRKRKFEDDEPLVPHGLIWQATEDLMPPKAESIAPKPRPAPDAQPVSIRMPMPKAGEPTFRRSEPAISSSIPGDRKPPEAASVPEPLPWPSLNAKNAVRRPPISDSNLAPNFWVSQPQQHAMEKPPRPMLVPPNADPISTPVSHIIAVPNASPAVQSNKKAHTDSKQSLVTFFREIGHAAAELCANVRLRYKDRQIARQFQHARERAYARLGRERTTLSGLKERWLHITTHGRSAMSKTFSAAGDAVRLAENRASVAIENYGNAARTIWTHRVRIRLTPGRQLRSVIASPRAWTIQARVYLRRNSRVSTSMAMAVLSAILTLGLITIVGRYQPTATTGVRLSSSQQANVSPQSVKINTSPLAVLPTSIATSLHKPSPASAAKSAKLEPKSPTATAPIHRVHHNQDEDYIAKDTYVYYGSRGKSSR